MRLKSVGLFDSEGNEIKVPKGKSLIMGQKSFGFVQIENEKGEDVICEYGTNFYPSHIEENKRNEDQKK